MADATLHVEQAEQNPSNKQAVYERHALRPHTKIIRVLDVRPIPQDATKSTPVECTLRIINLDLNPAFTALSYVWGKPTPKRSIICDGVVFDVGENCYSALWHLSKKLGGLVIWVDAICIDQEDVRKEKAWQIPLMGDIYTKAAQVYVWLGEGDDSSNRAMRYLADGGLKKYVNVVPDRPPQYRPYLAALRLGLSRWSLTYHPEPFRGNNSPLLAKFTRRVQYVSGADLVYLFDRPWKDRLWTYQEILLASYPVIVCGTEHVQWSDFEWTFLFLRSSFRHFPRAAIAWEAIVFDRGQLQSFNRPMERSVLHTLQEHETIVRKIILTRRWLLSTATGLLLAYTMTTLLVGVVSVCSRKYPEWRVHFVLARRTENAFMYIGIFGVFLCIIFICFELRPEYQTYRGDIKETASDDLVGALYQRAATDPRDMAYGIWAILGKRGVIDLSAQIYDVAKEAQIPLLYRQLTIHLFQTTGNLRFLHIAAARRLPGTPSWIPDWSTFSSNTWRDVPGYPGTDLHGIAVRYPPGSEDRLRMLRARQNLSVDSTQNMLTVLARDAGTVRGCVSFYPIKAIALEADEPELSRWNSLRHHWMGGFRHRSCRVYRGIETDERCAHVENLRSMLQWADWAQTIGCKIHAIFYAQPTLEELFPISAKAAWPSQKDRINWGKTLSGSRRDKLEGCLTLWMDGTKTPRWFQKFMATQNCLSTFIAEVERKICYVSSSVNPGTFCLLACSDKTKVDDRALLVCGLPGWIIVRKREESDNAIEIISPQILQGIAAIGKSRSLTNRDDAALDDLFIQYHIH